MRYIIFGIMILIPTLSLAQDLSSPDYFSSYGMPSTPSLSRLASPPSTPPAIDLTPVYAYPDTRSIAPAAIVSPTLDSTYLYPGAKSGDPVTVVHPNGTISYIYPGRR